MENAVPERLITTVSAWVEHLIQMLTFVAIGMFIAMGQLLQSRETITWRIAVGRCITTGGLSLVAGAALTLFPELPFVSQVGIAAALASLGSTGLELIAQRILSRTLGGIK